MTPQRANGWRTDGHAFIGRKTVRFYGEHDVEEHMSPAVVMAWLPATVKDPFIDSAGQPADLFRVLFQDGELRGEIEDVEARELLN